MTHCRPSLHTFCTPKRTFRQIRGLIHCFVSRVLNDSDGCTMRDDTEQRYGFAARSRNALSTPNRFRIGLFKPGASSASASNGLIGPDETSSCDEPAITLSTAFAHFCGETFSEHGRRLRARIRTGFTDETRT